MIRRATERRDPRRDNYIEMNLAYWFRLRDGFLGVEPTWHRDDVNGSDPEGVRSTLLNSLLGFVEPTYVRRFEKPKTLPQTITDTADERQSFRGLVGKTACTPRAIDDETIAEGEEQSSGCGTLINDMVNAMVQSPQINAVTPPLTSEDQARLQRTVLAVEPREGGRRVFRNFRCVTRSLPPGTAPEPVCEYAVRAKRLNVYPNAVELVFMDHDRELSNPVTPLFLWLKGTGGRRAVQQLCGRPTNHTVTLFGRTFVDNYHQAW